MPVRIRRAAAILLLLAALLPGQARADQTDPRLPGLFAQLHAATNHAEAAVIEAQIWEIWSESGDAALDALMEQGAAALAEGDGERALAAFDEVVRRAPAFAEGWNKRATTLYLLDRYVDSEADIAKVLALEPHHFGALSGLGLCEVRRDRLPGAIDAFRRALAVDPTLPGAAANIRALEEELARRSI